MPTVLVYMLQNTEYHAGPYLRWFWQTTHFGRVMYRRTLSRTRAARLLLLALRLGMLAEVAAGLLLLYLGWQHEVAGGLAFGAALVLAYPVVWAHLVVVPLELGRLFIVRPRQARAIQASRAVFAGFTGVKIAVAGSYGKTSMKELLLTVLSQGKHVAATPANKNVSISHAMFARKLTGTEDILIIEYGEGEPGDVARFTDITKPTHAVITGIAPAHLDRYKTLERAGQDIFSVGSHVPPEHVYINGDSPDALPFVRPGQQLYSEKSALGWKITGIQVGFDGTRFTMQKSGRKLELHSALLGRHQVGPLAFAAAIAHELGLSDAEIKRGIAATKPFEHRMEPYQLSGAWVIDDTYNGNIEGVRAGAQLLRDLPARRRIYVTPGLVDQGKGSAQIHERMGEIIAGAQPDMVVLMQHSVTPAIRKGLERAGFKGELLLETDPLNFYNNLNLFVAAGDVVMMQNDWPDNYA
ncbi:MAG TPA: UDP-N-acetylmuramoyl-tripeptide--D-alanyl-D-alanine ligase [Candidatus Saccharimonadales bacterium]|nr:UDP-N-acetylmuramoyl-tripeptide--D-alanyl-D-alanine ligase [Candidatus Saccharimonadales bacterium]